MAHITDAYQGMEAALSQAKAPYIRLRSVCLRLPLEKAIEGVFNRAVTGLAHLDMEPTSFSEDAAITGQWGVNLRGALAECRCEVLDRKKYPEKRAQYEDKVISTIFDFVKRGASHLKLAAFCSGRLLGEQILLFKLFAKLKGKALGRLQLFLIDRCYKKAIEDQQTENFMQQFLREISQVLPKGMECDVTFFDEASTYMAAAESMGDIYKHDLLFGADIYSCEEDIKFNCCLIAEMARRASQRKIQPIFLVQVENEKTNQFEGQICRINSLGNLINCFIPDAANTGCLKTSKLKIGVIGGIICIIVIAAIYIRKRLMSRSF